MYLRLTPNADLVRRRGTRWITTGSDPQLLVERRPGGPRYALIELAAEDRPLDVAVYTRARGAFSEAERIDFPERRRMILIADLAEGPAAGGLRLDPAEVAQTRLRLDWATARGRRGLARLLRRRLRAHPGTGVELIGPDPGLSGGRIGLPLPGRAGLAAELERIWDLAAVQTALEPLPGEAPTLSLLVPVCNARPDWLDTLLRSFLEQEPGAELILSDDGSTDPDTALWLATHDRVPGVRVLRWPENTGIAGATNRALAAARGDWVGLVDHDDALAPHAVARLRRALGARPGALFAFTDEVVADAEMRPLSLFAKPGFDPVLLSGMNYLNHLSLYRRDRLAALGGLRDGFHGSQDYELALRYCRGLGAERLLHVPYPAYVWRQRAESVSHAAPEVAIRHARKALAEHFGRVAGAAVVEAVGEHHRVRFPAASQPRISVVIPNRDSFGLISRVLEDLERRTGPAPLETIVIDNGSTDPRVLRLYEERAARGAFRAEIEPAPFNFAAMVNRGVAMARGDAVLLLNNDISVMHADWLGEMAACLAFPGTGVVGARLLFPDGTLQHAGVGLGLGGLAGHWYYRADPEEPGPMGRLRLRNGLSVVTGAAMLVSRACWESVGGMDAERFAVAYNDVDFCARAREAGFGVVWTPFATLTHHESASRGADRFGEKARRFRREQAALAARHDTATVIDPALSPWHARYRSHPRLAVPDRLPEPRTFMGFPGPLAEWAQRPRPATLSAAGRDDDRRPQPRSAQGSPSRP